MKRQTWPLPISLLLKLSIIRRLNTQQLLTVVWSVMDQDLRQRDIWIWRRVAGGMYVCLNQVEGAGRMRK